MKSIRFALPALIIIGLTTSAAAQFLAPGMPMPGQMPPQQQQLPPCFKEFQPIKAEAEKRGTAGRRCPGLVPRVAMPVVKFASV